MPEINIYFNRPEINTLYAQIMGWVPTERVKNDSQTIEGGLSAGIPVIGVKAGGAKKLGAKEQYAISEEQKLFEVKSHLRKTHQLIDGISEAVAHVLENNVGIFVQSKHQFYAPQFRDICDPVDAVNKAGSVLLECNVGSTKILVSLGLDHMSRVRGGTMSKLGHDAIIFREFGGEKIPLVIFGFLHSIKSRMQIRPITVSL
ncbi:hypothetical protein ACFLWV_03020 [Chloroflexota bacterium]